jgi:glycosyltransferase involved in cell wall biosynthesis
MQIKWLIWKFILKLAYFESQKGEWDSNGQALWSMAKYCQLTNTPPPAETVLGFVSRIAPEKNIEFLCKAVKKLMHQNEKISFLAVGNGPSEEYLKSYGGWCTSGCSPGARR